ncbi:MAG: tRNA (adenine-N1)-methyltransferase [Anaerolineales bacterium]|nr:tRNA (adenine-N1)-methyltransferase [Anaerolineales bacterium]
MAQARADEGDLALVIGADGKRFILRLAAGTELQTHRGVLPHDKLIGTEWGTTCHSHLGTPYVLLQPTLDEILLHLKRRSQIIFPKDLGYILLRMAIRTEMRVAEAGTGSGALTVALAWMVGPQGEVHSVDRREDMQLLAKSNLARLGLQDRVVFHLQDIAEGFPVAGLEALFLDLPDPQNYLDQARQALHGGGVIGAILPTANQVSSLIEGLNLHGFSQIDVCEILQRFYKTVPARLRPVDRMVAHTGYLVFARAVAQTPATHPTELDQASAEFDPSPAATEGIDSD